MVTTNSDNEQEVNNGSQKEDGGEFLTEIEILPCDKNQFKREESDSEESEEYIEHSQQTEEDKHQQTYDDQIENILTYFDADEMNAENKRHLKKLLQQRNARKNRKSTMLDSAQSARMKDARIIALTKYFQRKRDFYLREIDKIKLQRALLVLRARKIRLEIDQLQNE